MCFQPLGPLVQGILDNIAKSRGGARDLAFGDYVEEKKTPASALKGEPASGRPRDREDTAGLERGATPSMGVSATSPIRVRRDCSRGIGAELNGTAPCPLGAARSNGRQGPRSSSPRDECPSGGCAGDELEFRPRRDRAGARQDVSEPHRGVLPMRL